MPGAHRMGAWHFLTLELRAEELRTSIFFWSQKGFTAEPPRNDSGANFQWNDSDSGPKVGVTGRKSELQTKSPRYSPESEPNRPEKGPEWGLGASTETPLKADTGELHHRTMWQMTLNLKMIEENWTLPYCDRPFPGCLRGSVENPRLKGGVLKRK